MTDQFLTIYCMRSDLRIEDNPALAWAMQHGQVLPVYIEDPKFSMGQAASWWAHQALLSLQNNSGLKISCYKGNTLEILKDLVQRLPVRALVWNRLYCPARIEQDKCIKSYFKEQNLQCLSFNGHLLWEPWDISKADGSPYQVFSPFYYKGAEKAPKPRELVSTKFKVEKILSDEQSLSIEKLSLSPQHPWTKKLEENWVVSELRAQEKLEEFCRQGLIGYKDRRNIPSLEEGTSRLSPYLKHGLISPHQIWHYAKKFEGHVPEKDLKHFLSELGWREFSYYLMYHFPRIIDRNFQEKFDQFPWELNENFLEKWRLGKTGYPIVDAGLRELYATGYMHNRVRMIAGSFLIKNLLQHWKYGRDWFDDCLVDADIASNNASWQWVAGSGADAAPYFRVFNPILQGEKFDKDGLYIKKWLPELKKIPVKFIHKPFEAPPLMLADLGIVLGEHYPEPIVDLNSSRDKALEMYDRYIKKKQD